MSLNRFTLRRQTTGVQFYTLFLDDVQHQSVVERPCKLDSKNIFTTQSYAIDTASPHPITICQQQKRNLEKKYMTNEAI